MSRWIRCITLPALAMACSMALAQAPKGGDASKGAAAAGSTEAQVAARFAERAGMKPDQVFRGPAGLYEVLVRGELYYVDPAVTVVIMGRMFDSRTREDLTQKRLDTALRIDFKALPFDQAIKTVRGNGSRTMVTFEDPNCPYCKRLWQNMQQLNNVRTARQHGTTTWCRARLRPLPLPTARRRSSRTWPWAASSASTARRRSCSPTARVEPAQ